MPRLSADWPARGSRLYFTRCFFGRPCDLFEAVWHPDCNGNGVDDIDEIAAGALEDSDGNGVPDECDGR